MKLIVLVLLSVGISHALESNGSDNTVACEIDNDGNIQDYDDNNLILAASSETSIDIDLDNDIDGPKSDKHIEPVNEKNPREMSLRFKNKSNKKAKLWWKGFDGNNVLQKILDNNEEIIINTFWGHEFFFTPFDNEKDILYTIRMENHLDQVILYTKEEMKQRDKEFERKKNDFLKSYYNEHGRRWKNYYPRERVTHYMYDLENDYEIGDLIQPNTHLTKYKTCPSYLYDIDTFKQLLDRLMNEENNFKENEFPELNEKRIEFETENYDDRNYFRHVPAYSMFSEIFTYNESESNSDSNTCGSDGNNDICGDSDYNFKVVRYNGTILCQDLNNDEDIINMTVLCTEPRVVSISNFLSDEECDHIIEVGNYIGLRRSTVSESALKSQDRTSSTVWLERIMSPIVDTVVRRIGDAMGIDSSALWLNTSSESLQFVHYLGGELYKPHHDYGTDAPNNRFITFLMYLNDVEKGGNTSFPDASSMCKDDNNYFGIHPKKGNAAWFYDLYPDGNVDVSTLHYAEPPLNGSEKYMTNLWIWDPFFK